jgi:hypothetical protein
MKRVSRQRTTESPTISLYISYIMNRAIRSRAGLTFATQMRYLSTSRIVRNQPASSSLLVVLNSGCNFNRLLSRQSGFNIRNLVTSRNRENLAILVAVKVQFPVEKQFWLLPLRYMRSSPIPPMTKLMSRKLDQEGGSMKFGISHKSRNLWLVRIGLSVQDIVIAPG